MKKKIILNNQYKIKTDTIHQILEDSLMNGVQLFINNKKTINDNSKKHILTNNLLNNNMVQIFRKLLSLIQKVKEFRDFKCKKMKGDYKKILNSNNQWNSNKDSNIMKNRKICLISIKKRLTLSSRIVNKYLSR